MSMALNAEPDVRWLETVTLDPTREELTQRRFDELVRRKFFAPIEAQSRKNSEVLLKLLEAPPSLVGVYRVTSKPRTIGDTFGRGHGCVRP